MQQQKYFWACVEMDGKVHYEYAPDGTETYFPNLSAEVKAATQSFGLVSATDGFFFDLYTGEYHVRRGQVEYDKHPIFLALPKIGKWYRISEEQPRAPEEKYDFYQFKQGHTNFNMALQSSGNIIDKHIIGYKGWKQFGEEKHFVDVRLTLDPNDDPAKPYLEVTLKESEGGPVIGTQIINVQ